ncbi:inosose dehydratase [Gracilibacillus halotolerans]|uniref:Inosose dehydratase n=1 Tax=Gracilibacillus halotolerans TaxID=74386 RepID=A0A841RQ46_9BACI|nr:sugar phosphate isomerase/epimerase [Gracilibacillus halotolerans]MBB6513315.1 inosose dehydratase [Gracilibacillus halotolerans]
MKLGYVTNCWGGVVGHPGGVTSVKDAYYLANGSTEEALSDLNSLGYQGFEIFDGNLMQYENSKEDFKNLMKKNELTLIGVYTGANFIYDEILDEELAKINKVAHLANEFGAKHLVIGGGAIRSAGINDTDYKKLGDALEKVKVVAENHNLLASYHPHLGSTVETIEQTRELIKHTSIHLCPDTAHLQAAGSDPAEFIKEFKDRIQYVHLKDFGNDNFQPLGEGTQNLTQVIKELKHMNYNGWITVELDSYYDPKEGAKISKNYLQKNL